MWRKRMKHAEYGLGRENEEMVTERLERGGVQEGK
jgi:hypothetical protein